MLKVYSPYFFKGMATGLGVGTGTVISMRTIEWALSAYKKESVQPSFPKVENEYSPTFAKPKL